VNRSLGSNVDATRGFIDDKQPRVHLSRPAEQDLLLVASGQRSNSLLDAVESEVHGLGQFLGGGPLGSLGHPATQ
jgi:hypothetical protein